MKKEDIILTNNINKIVENLNNLNIPYIDLFNILLSIGLIDKNSDIINEKGELVLGIKENKTFCNLNHLKNKKPLYISTNYLNNSKFPISKENQIKHYLKIYIKKTYFKIESINSNKNKNLKHFRIYFKNIKENSNNIKLNLIIFLKNYDIQLYTEEYFDNTLFNKNLFIKNIEKDFKNKIKIESLDFINEVLIIYIKDIKKDFKLKKLEKYLKNYAKILDKMDINIPKDLVIGYFIKNK